MRTDLVEQAKAIRAAMQVTNRYMPDEVAFKQPSAIFDAWSADSVAYELNDIRRYEDKLYRCVTAHTSQASWTPAAAASLWAEISDPTEEWPAWIQPTGAHNAYAAGAKVAHNDKHWISDVANNTWEPGVYGWTEAVEEAAE